MEKCVSGAGSADVTFLGWWHTAWEHFRSYTHTLVHTDICTIGLSWTHSHTIKRVWVLYIPAARNWWKSIQHHLRATLTYNCTGVVAIVTNVTPRGLQWLPCEDLRKIDGGRKVNESPVYIFSSSVFVSRINWLLRNKDEVIVRRIIFVQTWVPRRHQRQTTVSPLFLAWIKLRLTVSLSSPGKYQEEDMIYSPAVCLLPILRAFSKHN